MDEKRPWLRFYGDIPPSIDYPQVTMYEALKQTVEKTPDALAYDFFGTTATYRQFAAEIDRCADALAALGLKQGDRMTISMPTCPQAIVCFYAINKLGGVASMIHPLSTASEIEFYLNLSQSRFALTLDAFYGKFKEVETRTGLERLILARIPDYLGWVKRLGFNLTKGRKIPSVPDDSLTIWWREMMGRNDPSAPKAATGFKDLAVILYSGGTTGTPKGIMLSNENFICEGMQVSVFGNLASEDAILAILPVFHGFGLGVCINAAFMGGAKSILVPQFTPEDVAKLIRSKRPNFIVGVPTLFEALSRSERFRNSDLSCITAAFSGADTLPRVVKERFEAVVRKQGGHSQLREGYGLTEAVTAIMAMPMSEYREGSVGIPFPDMDAKIVARGTTESLSPGEEGEICISGPAVMIGYLDNAEETAKTLKTHADGRIWLHTGDVGTMDPDGFFYFKLREKRMIKSSGMNVYPAQVEDLLYKHPAVLEACVIGVPDEKQVERVKAFVVLNDPEKAGTALEKELIDFCRKDLIKWSCPREIEFRSELPLTLVGKVAFNELVLEEIEKLKGEGKFSDGNK
ncbi:MAG: AMP-binding protein [Desulfobacterales bacterium]|nr:AMP-binding protein [Desulfobacterales bacterium]